MFRWSMPVGCLCLVAAVLFGALVLRRLDGTAIWAGVGVLALLVYAAAMCVHYFERSPPSDRPVTRAGARGRCGRAGGRP